MEFRPVDAGRLRPLLDPADPERGAEGVRDAGPHPPALGRRALHRGDRSLQEGLRRARAGHQRGGGEHRAVPPVHLREQLHLPRRQHPRAARPHARRGPGASCVWGPEDAGLVRLLDEHPLPGAAAVGAARAGRDLRGAAEAGLQLPRPAGAVRHHDQAARHARRRCAWSAASARRSTATPICRSWRRGWACSWSERGVAAGRAGDAVRQERARVGDGLLRHAEGGRHGRAGRPRIDGGRAGERRARLRARRHADRRRPATRRTRTRSGARSREAGLPTKLWPFSEAFELPDLEVEQERAAGWCAARARTRWRR